MRMNQLLKGLIGASIALALAGGAQASGQENASTTAPDKTQNDASTPKKSAAKATKATKAKKSKSTSSSEGSSTSGQSGKTGNSGTTGTMDNGTDTATDPGRTGSAGTTGAAGDTRSSGGVIDNRVRTTGVQDDTSAAGATTGTSGTTGTTPPNNSGATPTNTGR